MCVGMLSWGSPWAMNVIDRFFGTEATVYSPGACVNDGGTRLARRVRITNMKSWITCNDTHRCKQQHKHDFMLVWTEQHWGYGRKRSLYDYFRPRSLFHFLFEKEYPQKNQGCGEVIHGCNMFSYKEDADDEGHNRWYIRD